MADAALPAARAVLGLPTMDSAVRSEPLSPPVTINAAPETR